MAASPETQFAVAVLRKWGRPVTTTSVRNVLGWMKAEGGHTNNKARFNYLNTTQPAPGAGNTGTQGNIKVYPNFQTGVDATVKTLNNGRYAGIGAAVNADPSTFARAVNQSPWGTKSDFSSIINSTSVGAIPASGAAAASTVPAALPQQSAGQLDTRKLTTLLNQTQQRVLSGQMPGPSYQAELSKLAEQAYPRAQVVAGAQSVGAGVAQAATSVTGAVADRSAAQAINAAKTALGLPYSWGGGTPSGPTNGFGRGANTVGFDCSSLVQMAWSKAGVSLPRTTYQQIKVGRAVNAASPGSWRPGDLLFPSTGHVQMYIGNGQVIEAPRTGGKVQIVPIRSKYIAVRRPSA